MALSQTQYEKAIDYNRGTSERFDWGPDWFGGGAFDNALIDAITAWQEDLGLTADGWVGPATYRRKWLEREADSDWMPRPEVSGTDYIIHNGEEFPCEMPVLCWNEEGGFPLVHPEKGTYGYTNRGGKEPRQITQFVNHWDVCLSSKSCVNILRKRGISVHFAIDNDGMIYQLLDTQHIAWHAGGRDWNARSVGVEISNAYYPKYNAKYEKRGFGLRPIVESAPVHGATTGPFTDFYPVQLKALQALWKALHLATGIPLEVPMEDGELNTGVDSRCVDGSFQGFIQHYHLKRTKIDCAGMDMVGLMDDVRGCSQSA